MIKKFLIIRFSSFGDIVQCLGIVDSIKSDFPDMEIHWVVRSDYADVVKLHPLVNRVWSLDRFTGSRGLKNLSKDLILQNFDYIYDAHSSIRSFILLHLLKKKYKNIRIIKRSKRRFARFLLFKLRINLYPQPFRGIISYIKPLKKIDFSAKYLTRTTWNIPPDSLKKINKLIPQDWNNSYIVIAPSAAWEMKRWPVVKWQELVKMMNDFKIVILGGPKDFMCNEIAHAAKDRALNLAGRTSLIESCGVVLNSLAVISADTGILHVADIMGKNTIALMGPTAFGFPSGDNTKVVESYMKCRPCTKDGRGNCSITHTSKGKCMEEITAYDVFNELNIILNVGKSNKQLS